MSVVKSSLRKSKFLVIKFVANKQIFSVPGAWVSVEEANDGSGERKIVKASCLWTYEVPESKLIHLAMKLKKPGISWTPQDVQILAKAENFAEVIVKENMAKKGCINVDAEYAQEEEQSKKMRSSRKRKMMDDAYTDGKEFSTGKEDSSPESTSEEDDEDAEDYEKPVSPPESIFKAQQNNASNNASLENRGPVSNGEKNSKLDVPDEDQFPGALKNSDASPKKEKNHEAEEDDLAPALENCELVPNGDKDGESTSNSKEDNMDPGIKTNKGQDTWHVVKFKETGKWHVVPSSWADTEKSTCSYPPAEKRKGQIKSLIWEQREPGDAWETRQITRINTTKESFMSADLIRATLNANDKDNAEQFADDDKKSQNEGTFPESENANEPTETIEDSLPALDAENNGVDEDTWHVVQFLESDKWHVIPSFWLDTKSFSCSYPPAQEKKKAIKLFIKERRKPDHTWREWNVTRLQTITRDYTSAAEARNSATADDRAVEMEFSNDNENDENRGNLPELPKAKKPKITSSVTLAMAKPKIPQKQSSSISNAELNKMDTNEKLNVLIRQNEEQLKISNNILVEINELGSRPSRASSTFTLPARDIFPITSVTRLLEIEDQLAAEAKALVAKKKLPSDNLTDIVINCFNNQGGKDGHACLTNMMRISLDDRVQKEYSFKGKGKKVGFCKLELYRLMKEVAVASYASYKDVNADDSCSKWLKGAKKRIEGSTANDDEKAKSTKNKLKEIMRKEKGEHYEEI